MAVFFLCPPKVTEGTRELLGFSFIRALILFMNALSSYLLTSQRSYFQTPPCWQLGFNRWNAVGGLGRGGYPLSVYSTVVWGWRKVVGDRLQRRNKKIMRKWENKIQVPSLILFWHQRSSPGTSNIQILPWIFLKCIVSTLIQNYSYDNFDASDS